MSEPEPYKLFVNEERTVLVRWWPTEAGAPRVVEVAMRETPSHTWGPPVYCRPERTS